MTAFDMQRKRVRFHLNILSVLFCILAALCAVLATMLGITLIYGVTHEPRPYESEVILSIVFLSTAISGVLVALLLNALTAYGLWRQCWWGLCLATAILALCAFPLGTGVGVYAIVILSRSSTRAFFNGNAAS